MRVEEAGPGLPGGPAWGDRVERSRTVTFDLSRPELRRVHQRDFCDPLDLRGQSECGVKSVPKGDVEVRINGEGRASLWGLKTCGSVWACPVCSSRETRSRARELERAVESCIDRGGAVYMVTATIPHHAGHRCDEVLEAVSSSWSYVLGGSPWKRWADRIGYMGSVRGLDVTHSERAGWHWHVHALVFCREPIPAEVREKWRNWLSDRWKRKVEAWYECGGSCEDEECDGGELHARPLNREIPDEHVPYFGSPHPKHGVQIQRGQNAAEYLASIGLARELTRMECKRGRGDRHRTPWQILHDYAETGSDRDAHLWREYVRASKGRAQLYWSPGLREALDLEEQLELDFEEKSETSHVVTIHSAAWWHAASLCPNLEDRILRAAEERGREGVVEALASILEPDGWRVMVDERDGSLGCQRTQRRAA